MKSVPTRGQIYLVDIGYGAKPWLIVSNNTRNRVLDTALAARITTTDKSQVPTAVQLGRHDPLVGYVLADDLEQLDEQDLASATYRGTVGPDTILKVNQALTIALGLA